MKAFKPPASPTSEDTATAQLEIGVIIQIGAAVESII